MRLLLFAALPLMAQSYLLTTLAGSGDEGGKGDGGMATDARLVGPQAMACDPLGNCFIAETYRVRRVGADGRISTFGGTATMPRDIGTDAQGNVYVLETSGAFRILKFSADGVMRAVIDPEVFIQEIAVAPDGTVFWLTWEGLVRQRPDGTRTMVPIVSEFQAQGLAADSAGNAYIYVASRKELHRIDTAGNDVTQPFQMFSPNQLAVDGAGNLFYTAADGQSSVRRDPQGRVTSFPATLFFTPNGRGGLYVLAQDTIVNVEASGARTVYAGGGGGDGGPLYNATFSGRDLVSDRAGNLYVTDWDLKSVRKISATGVVSTVARGFAGPLGIAMDAAENLYVADTLANQIKKVSRTGQVTVVAGTGVEGFGGDGGPALQAGLSFPMDVTVDGDGSLYITDSRTRVRRISTDGRIATLVGPDRLTGADSVTVDRQGNLYIADSYGAKILRRTPGGEITTIAEGFEVPTGLTVDSAGTLYFSQAVLYRIWKVAPGGKPVLVAGNGNRDGVGDNGLATQASLLGPYGMTFDPAGNLLFTDHRC
jgi:sugar lactone lactonase YvrE